MAKTFINSDLIQRYQELEFLKWNIYGGKFVFYEVQYTIAILFIQDGRLEKNYVRIVYGGWLQLIWMCFHYKPYLHPFYAFFLLKKCEFGSQYLYRLVGWKHIEASKIVITNKSFFNYFWIEYGHYILDFFFHFKYIWLALDLI